MKFQYAEKVKVINGFYKGFKGIVIDCKQIFESDMIYHVIINKRIKTSRKIKPSLWIFASKLEKL